jgi:hypothetical protein
MNYLNNTTQAVAVAREIEQLRVRVGHMKEDFERRVEQLTPIEGWPGSNTQVRDAAKAKAVLDDDTCQALRTDIRNGETRLAALTADQVAFEIERRDREWGIRRELIDVIREKGISEALPF